MIIANPIYDSVFKYLLEDIEIAQELLATIMSEDIVSISVQPQETIAEVESHSYTIQIPSLTDKLQTRIEKVLMIFSPKYKTSDRHKLDYLGSVDDPLISKILNRLIRAASDEQMRKNMDVEDEVENTIANLLREKDEKLAAKDKQLAEKKLLIEEERKRNAENDAKLAEKEKQNEELLRIIQEMKEQRNNK